MPARDDNGAAFLTWVGDEAARRGRPLSFDEYEEAGISVLGDGAFEAIDDSSLTDAEVIPDGNGVVRGGNRS